MPLLQNDPAALVMAVAAALVPAGAVRAQDAAAATGWKLYESPDACSLGGQPGGAFVFLSINPEGEAMLRVHHPDMTIAGGESRTGVVQVGAKSFGLSAQGAYTSDGTPGFAAPLTGAWREVLSAEGDAAVMVPTGQAIPLDLAGLADALPLLDACTARLKPRDPDSIVAVKPRPTRMPAITPAQLPLEGATRREVGFRLTVTREGRAGQCDITRSSGSEPLDAKVCQLLIAGTRFTPARNAADKPVAGSYQSRVVF